MTPTILPNVHGFKLVRAWHNLDEESEDSWWVEVLPVIGFIVEDPDESPSCLLASGSVKLDDEFNSPRGEQTVLWATALLDPSDQSVTSSHDGHYESADSFLDALRRREEERKRRENEKRTRPMKNERNVFRS